MLKIVSAAEEQRGREPQTIEEIAALEAKLEDALTELRQKKEKISK